MNPSPQPSPSLGRAWVGGEAWRGVPPHLHPPPLAGEDAGGAS
jgi:hypothetical protein